jgi:ankyrin repeat protein
MDVDPLLIRHGADAAAQNKPRTTPLHRASIQGHVDVARWHRAAAQVKYGPTPLHRASFRGYVDVAPLLIKYGAYAAAQDTCETTPLH